jgi:hypothetical protein
VIACIVYDNTLWYIDKNIQVDDTMTAYINWVLNGHEYEMTFNQDSLFKSLTGWVQANKHRIQSYSIECNNYNRKQAIEDAIESVLSPKVIVGDILEVLSMNDYGEMTTLKNHFYVDDKSICGRVDLHNDRYDVIGDASFIECKSCRKKVEQ